MSTTVKTVSVWILQILVVGILATAALPKIGGDPNTVEVFGRLGIGNFGRILVGALELVAALLLLTPYTAAKGALLGWGVMSGALIAHLTRLGFSGDMLATGLLALAVWLLCAIILYLRRDEIEFIRCMFERDGE